MSGPSLDTRPLWAEIDLGALASNYRELVRRIRGGVKVIASIKADGYGHGAVPVARTLSEEGVDALATGSFADAVAIRQAGIGTPILLFGSHLPAGIAEVLRHDLIPTVYNLEAARAVSEAARRPTPVYVKVDSGLGRLGVAIEEAEAFVKTVAALPRVVVEGIYTHLPFVDRRGQGWAVERLSAFRVLVDALRRSGLDIPVTQALSSAGALAHLEDGCNAVCPGHVLYGIPAASPEVMDVSPFRPVLRAVKARLIHVAAHRSARSAGIGGQTLLAAGAVTGVVPVGRYDGYRSARDGQAQMLVRGRRVPVRGLSLEHSTLDLSGVGEAEVGDEVVVLGEQGGERIALAELAAWQGVSVVDVLMTLDRRVPYRYVEAGQPAGESEHAVALARGG